MKYVQLLEDLKNVIHDCFGNYLEPTFDKSIEKFRQNYLSSGLSVTPKIHAIFFMFSTFVKRKVIVLDFIVNRLLKVFTMISIQYGRII